MTSVAIRRWEVRATLSCVGFTVRNFGIKNVKGQIPIVTAWADVDAGRRPVAVHAELDLAGLATDNARRDRDLAKPGLLDTAKYPTLVFDCSDADPDGTGWVLAGTVHAHGMSTPVTLHADVLRTDGDTVTVHASGAFDRTDLGIRAPRFLIGRRITIGLDVVLAAG